MTANASPTTTCSERSALTSGLAVLGMGLIVATLTGCSLLAPYQKEQQQHYDTYSDAPSKANSEDLAWSMPTWVPEDAEDIDVRLDTEEPGYVIAFDSAQGVDTAACTPLDGPHGGPAMSAGFLPDTLPKTGLLTCGDGRATAEVDGRWYGWTTKDAIAADANDTLRAD
jgi:hypothetical protein